MQIREKTSFIILLIAVFAVAAYMIRSILSPFIFSTIVAYFLHPLIDKISSKTISRTTACLLIIGGFLLAMSLVAIFLIPIIFSQISSFISDIPSYIQIASDSFYPKISMFLQNIGIDLEREFYSILANQEMIEKSIHFFNNVLINIFSSSVTLVNVVSTIFITPILIFYLIKDWHLLIKNINEHLPKNISIASKEIINEIDKALSGFVRGQILVCLILSFIYCTLLTLSGLKFGFLVGILTGFLTFIPYVGALSGFAVAIILSILQWGFSASELTTISMIFVFCQILESNFLSPKLIGKNIGLHPAWIIFGLFLFGELFGFIGILFATPLTAICGVLIKHIALEYKKRIL